MKGTILVVDDERNQREILGSILTDEGYRTLLAGSGQEALDTLDDKAEVFYYLCPVCGNIEKAIPEKCPICGVPGDKFIK